MLEEVIMKLVQEMKDFKSEVREKGVDFAIDKAYELTVKQEIIDVLQYDTELSKVQQKAILSKENVLSEIYDDWLSEDGNLRGDLQFTVDKSLNSITGSYKKKVQNMRENSR